MTTPSSAPARPSAEVVVVGAGPVGSAFALDLAQRGVDVLVVDPDADVVFDGRARTLSARAMEHLRAWGVAEQFHEASPIPAEWFAGTSFRTSINGRELLRTPPPARVGQRVLSSERSHRLPQNRTTTLLRAAAERAGARFLLGWEATGFEQDDVTAVVPVRSLTGETAALTAQYVVASDGSRSVVRRAAGITREATELQGHQYSVIVEVPGVFEATGTAPNAFNWIWNDTLSDAFNPFEPDRYGMSIGPFPEPVDLSPERIADEVAARVGLRLPHRTVSITTYRIQKRIASTFRLGRLLVAGDAAHAFPPSLGMNLNTGVADAGNGAWKLAAVLQGWGGEELLESYDSERRLAAHRVGDATLEARGALDRRIDYLRGRTIPEGDDPAATAEREEIVRVLQAIRATFTGSDGAALDQRYDHSAVVVPDGTPATSWSAGAYEPVWRPGHRVPHVRLRDGRSLHDVLARGLTLLVREGDTVSAHGGCGGDLVATARALRVPLAVRTLDGALDPDVLGSSVAPPRRLALVRPDQTLAWHGDELPEDLTALLRVVTGSSSRASGVGSATRVDRVA